MIQKAAAMSNWWLAASSWQHTHSCITSHAGFWQNIKSPRWFSTPYSPDLVPCDFWLFPKPNHLWKGRDFRLSMRFRKIRWGSWWQLGELWGPKLSTLKGTKVSLSCEQCFLYLLFSSISVSIFHITWLDTFWIDLEVLWGILIRNQTKTIWCHMLTQGRYRRLGSSL